MPDYDRDQIARIKSANDLVDVIGQSVPLKRIGASFVGMCPWCEGRKPKLTVTPAKQSYKCWRCGEWGDVVTWTMKQQGQTFPQALESLARRAGVSF